MQLTRRQAGAAINSGRHDGSGGTDARHWRGERSASMQRPSFARCSATCWWKV